MKKPSIAETLDWAEALHALGVRELTPEIMRSTVGFVLKNNEDIDTIRQTVLAAEDGCDCGHDGESCGCGHDGEGCGCGHDGEGHAHHHHHHHHG